MHKNSTWLTIRHCTNCGGLLQFAILLKRVNSRSESPSTSLTPHALNPIWPLALSLPFPSLLPSFLQPLNSTDHTLCLNHCRRALGSAPSLAFPHPTLQLPSWKSKAFGSPVRFTGWTANSSPRLSGPPPHLWSGSSQCAEQASILHSPTHLHLPRFSQPSQPWSNPTPTPIPLSAPYDQSRLSSCLFSEQPLRHSGTIIVSSSEACFTFPERTTCALRAGIVLLRPPF